MTSESEMPTRIFPNMKYVVDIVIVLFFAWFGMQSHEVSIDLPTFMNVAAPFVIGLFIGWFVVYPIELYRPKLRFIVVPVLLAVCTVFFGMLVRYYLFHGGVEPSFIAVATIYFLITFVGVNLITVGIKKLIKN